MIKATVIGQIWTSRRLAAVPSGALLEVQTDAGARLVAFDPIGCAAGETVLLTTGSVAAGWFKNATVPIDALIIGAIEPA